MPLKTTPLEDMPALNLTSMIDVLFLLIIFFVVGTKFVDSDRQIQLDVPKVGNNGALTAPPGKKVVTLYRDGQIELDSHNLSLEQLTTRLAAARSQYQRLGVLVRGDGGTSLQQVASVLNACKQAGISDLGISVRLAANSKGAKQSSAAR
jgi:biopolymer transport protein ExbD